MTKKNDMSKNIEGAQRVVLEILKTGEAPIASLCLKLRNRGYSDDVASEAVLGLYENGCIDSGTRGSQWVCIAGSV